MLLCGHETWFITAESVGEQGAKDSFGTKREKVTQGWRKFHEKFHGLYSAKYSQESKIKAGEMGGTCSV
jgi:hypothetical protein